MGERPVEIDGLSRLLGAIETQLITLANTVHSTTEMAASQRMEMQRQLASATEEMRTQVMELNKIIIPLKQTVEIMEPLVRDWDRSKSKAIGFIIAISFVWTVIGFAISQVWGGRGK